MTPLLCIGVKGPICTSKRENVSISVNDPGAPSGSWNLMQFVVKHNGLVLSSGTEGQVPGRGL